MKTKIAINGFGRIGRLALRNLIDHDEAEIVAVNDLADADMLVNLLKYDSAHGRFKYELEMANGHLKTNGKTIPFYSEDNPVNLPWDELDVDVVIECSGAFLTREKANLHLDAGAKRVVLSANAKSDDITTIVMGVNDDDLKADDQIVSNASCTTNCMAPMTKVLNDQFGVEKGYMTTVHAYTSSQKLLDSPHKKDMRRARAAAASIIPTSTGAAQAVELVIPDLKGKLDGLAMRVPVITGSITDCTFILKQEASVEKVNAAMKESAEGPLKGIMEYTEEPIVSTDIIGNKHSCIFDAQLSSVRGNLLKVCAWYDNEAGYAARVVEMALRIGALGKQND